MAEGAVLHVQFGAQRFYWLSGSKGSFVGAEGGRAANQFWPAQDTRPGPI